MPTDFQFKPLQYKEFSKLFTMDNAELTKIGARRMTADQKPGFPCRVSLEDAKLDEEVILLPYQHHKTDSPYQSVGPIFIRKNAKTAVLNINEIPQMLDHRLLSVRAYDKAGMMKEATVVEGQNLREMILQMFNNQEIEYLRMHNAKPGCYNCLVERV